MTYIWLTILKLRPMVRWRGCDYHFSLAMISCGWKIDNQKIEWSNGHERERL